MDFSRSVPAASAPLFILSDFLSAKRTCWLFVVFNVESEV